MRPRAIDLGTGAQLPPALVGVMVLLDRSGSMATIHAPMVQGFNQFVETQRVLSVDGMWVTLHQFDTDGYEEVYERKPLADVGPLDLHPRGGTPLRDALYRFVQKARTIVDDPNDPTERLLLVVVTDGQENASHERTWPQVKEAVQGIESTDCELIWMGTDAAIMEAQAHVPSMAAAGATLRYSPTEQGVNYMAKGFTQAAYASRAGLGVKCAVSDYATSGGTYDAKDDDLFQAEWDKIKDKVKSATGSSST